MEIYKIKVNARWGIEKITLYGNTFQKAVEKFFRECIESDNTGYFFEVEDADISSLKGNKHIYYVDDVHGEYAIEVVSFEVI